MALSVAEGPDKPLDYGSIALGDSAIDELFVLAADMGHQRIKVLKAPRATPSRRGRRGWANSIGRCARR